MAATLLHEIAALRAELASARAQGQRVALVPTMGALHEGHLTLVREAARHAELVLVSVFVNPTQFGPNEDFSKYPRTLDADHQALHGVAAEEAARVVLFAPSAAEMYPPGDATRVRVEGLDRSLCGPLRPGHFEGVATVVSKLLVLAGECTAVFGRKDYQQLQVIRRLAADLLLPVRIVGVPTVREADGLAKSSRNRYLQGAERARALSLSRGLAAVQHAHAEGERRVGVLEALLRAELAPVDSVEYAGLYDADDLRPLAGEASSGDRALVAIAARLGATRLIDNVVLGEDAPLRSAS